MIKEKMLDVIVNNLDGLKSSTSEVYKQLIHMSIFNNVMGIIIGGLVILISSLYLKKILVPDWRENDINIVLLGIVCLIGVIIFLISGFSLMELWLWPKAFILSSLMGK